MKLIETFEKIRDLPYHCPESLDDNDYRCWGKHRILYNELTNAGFKVRYRVCEFNWKDQKFPKDIVALAPNPTDKHLFLEIKLKYWIKLDCSSDSSLPSYNTWKGKADCLIDVKYTKIYSPEESAEIEATEDFKKDFDKYKEFYIAINKFLEKIRNA